MNLVTIRPMFEGMRGPLVIEPASGRRDLGELLRDQTEAVDEKLLTHGALLFRGFAVRSLGEFDGFISAVARERMGYLNGSSPRRALGNSIFTSTEHPPDLEIALHNECAYQHEWPLKIAFCCLVPSNWGGETPLADMRLVTGDIGTRLVEEFESRGVRYVRHFRPYVDVPWQEVFQTQDRAELARLCDERGIAHEWLDRDTLRTVQQCDGIVRHPRTGERFFFNQAHLFHSSSLGEDDEKALVELYGRDRLPKHACFGDGAEIPLQDLEVVRRAFRARTVSFQWRSGDVLLLDNLQFAHGRRPLRGERRVIVALLEPHSQAAGQAA